MSGQVPHRRPEIASFDGTKSGQPVSADDWTTLAYAANWVHGHGAQVIPWCAVGADVSSGGSGTVRFQFRSKSATVARVWALNLLSDTDGATATVTINGTAHDAVRPVTSRSNRRGSHVFVETLSSKPTGVTSATVQVAASGGTITIESLAAYDQTRNTLLSDETDWGVETTTLRARQPIADFDYQSISGVCDAEKRMDARRVGHLAWSVPTSVAISPGSTTLTDLFPLEPPDQAPVLTGTQGTVTLRVYSKVSTGTGSVKATSSQAADSVTVSVTRTSFGWDTGTVNLESESLTAANGQRSGKESWLIQGADPTGGTLSIAALCIVRDESGEKV